MTGTALDTAQEFIDRLDRNDAGALAEICDPTGTWWVDTGLDRAAGVPGHDPGADRPWPLHGTMPLGEKVELLRGLPERFPGGCRQQRWNSFVGDDRAVVEVEGSGMYLGTTRYANRYAFVVDCSDGVVEHVREYLDTAHAADVFHGRNLERRTVAPTPTAATIDAGGPLTALAIEFAAAISAADPERILAISEPSATWWADSGPDRERGRLDVDAAPGAGRSLVGKAILSERVASLPGLISTFSGGWSLEPQRVTEGASSVAIEAASHGVLRSGRTYQNRYCFVLDAPHGTVQAVREYCDTLHAFDVFRIS